MFFALYAASFGNHLSMILFLPPFAVFLLLTTPEPPFTLASGDPRARDAGGLWWSAAVLAEPAVSHDGA